MIKRRYAVKRKPASIVIPKELMKWPKGLGSFVTANRAIGDGELLRSKAYGRGIFRRKDLRQLCLNGCCAGCGLLLIDTAVVYGLCPECQAKNLQEQSSSFVLGSTEETDEHTESYEDDGDYETDDGDYEDFEDEY